MTVGGHLRLGKGGGACRHGAHLGADDGCDLPGVDAFVDEAAGHRHELGPGGGQCGAAGGAVDLVAEHDGGRRAVAQQVARGDGAGERTGVVDDGEVADAVALDAADGAIDEVVLAHGDERRLHQRPDRCGEARGTAGIDGAQ